MSLLIDGYEIPCSVSDEIIRQGMKQTFGTDTKFSNIPELENGVYRGKVRINYRWPNNLRVIITTDDVSAFDRVLGRIPFGGQVRHQLAVEMFKLTEPLFPNHILEIVDQNTMIVEECEAIPVEFVVRGYLTGSTKTSIAYHYFELGKREYAGYIFTGEMKRDQRLSIPIVTPSTKALEGKHDETISRQMIIENHILAPEVYDFLAGISLGIFTFLSRYLESRNLILVDFKLEFGRRRRDGAIVLMDEVGTVDACRFWPLSEYQKRFNGELPQIQISKEFVRQYYTIRFNYRGDGPVPTAPEEFWIQVAKVYVGAYELITGKKFEPFIGGDARNQISKNVLSKYDKIIGGIIGSTTLEVVPAP